MADKPIPEMVERLARFFDPEAFILRSKEGVNIVYAQTLGDATAVWLIARQQGAYMKARALLLGLREPSKEMPKEISIYWRRLIDAALGE